MQNDILTEDGTTTVTQNHLHISQIFTDQMPFLTRIDVMVTRMDVLMCFRADILLEIPRVHISK